MAVYFMRRLVQSAVIFLLITMLLFLLAHLMPGGPLAMYAHTPGITAAQLARLRRNFGLASPLWQQYVTWFVNAIHGNFGYSYFYGQPAITMVWQRIGATAELMLTSFMLAAIAAVIIGVTTAIRQYSWWDYSMTACSYFGMSLPGFWFALLSILLFAVYLPWLPSGGIGGPGLASRIHHLILPALILASYTLAHESRYVRSSMLEVLHADYIRTAHAKGLGPRAVFWVHALRNAMIPVVTVMALDAAFLFSGALVVETIFHWPGMGRLFYQAIQERDYPVMMAVVTLLSLAIVLANLVADLLYGYLDPRVRYW